MKTNAACPDCKDPGPGGTASGITIARNTLGKIVHLLMAAGGDAADKKPPHPWLRELGIKKTDTAIIKLTTGLAGRAPTQFGGHDALDRWEAEKKIIAAAGLDSETWGICPTCKGSCEVPDKKEAG